MLSYTIQHNVTQYDRAHHPALEPQIQPWSLSSDPPPEPEILFWNHKCIPGTSDPALGCAEICVM